MRKGEKALLERINAGLGAIRANGTYNQIYKKWFNQDFKPQ